VQRRPILAAAFVVGASKSAAKHEVAKQSQQSAEAQRWADVAAQCRGQEEVARDAKTQLAINDAIAKERSRSISPLLPTQISNGHEYQSGQARAVTAGYCLTCGMARQSNTRFCGGCGHSHDNVPRNSATAEYRTVSSSVSGAESNRVCRTESSGRIRELLSDGLTGQSQDRSVGLSRCFSIPRVLYSPNSALCNNCNLQHFATASRNHRKYCAAPGDRREDQGPCACQASWQLASKGQPIEGRNRLLNP
jgi:hypothetical protein